MSHPYLGMSEAEQYDALRDKGVSPQQAANHIVALRTAREGQAADMAAQGPTTEHPLESVGAGLADAALDIPRGIATAVMHPLNTLGQITGAGNIPAAWQALQDPEANWAEKADALVRATPLNVGYAPERALLDATGATSDTPASLEEQVHRMGNVGSLALLGLRNRPGNLGSVAPNLAKAGISRLVGSRLGNLLMDARTGNGVTPITDAPSLVAARRAAVLEHSQLPTGGPLEDIEQAIADHAAGRLSDADFDTAMGEAGRQTGMAGTPSRVAPTVPQESPVPAAAIPPQGATNPAPVEAPPRVTGGQPLPGSPRGMTAVGPPTPPVPNTPTVTDFQNRMAGRTTPYYPRGGQLEQAVGAPPVSSMPPSPANMVEASRPLAQALGQGGFEQVTSALDHPAYQNAELLARRAIGQGLAPFSGMSIPDATALLRQMIVEQAERGGEVPPLTSLPRFLQRLQAVPAAVNQ